MLTGTGNSQGGEVQRFGAVEASAFIVRNTEGKLVATLGMNSDGERNRPRLALYDLQGNAQVEMAFDEANREASLSLGGDPFGPKAFWQINASGNPLYRGVNAVMRLSGDPTAALFRTFLSGSAETEEVLTYLAAEANLTPQNKIAIVFKVNKMYQALKCETNPAQSCFHSHNISVRKLCPDFRHAAGDRLFLGCEAEA